MVLTPIEIKEIIISYNLYNGNAEEAARHLPYTTADTIRNYWRRNNLKLGDHGGKRVRLEDGKISGALTDDEISNIIRAHKICNGNAREASMRLNHRPDTILKYWKLNGLQIKFQRKRRGTLESKLSTN